MCGHRDVGPSRTRGTGSPRCGWTRRTSDTRSPAERPSNAGLVLLLRPYFTRLKFSAATLNSPSLVISARKLHE